MKPSSESDGQPGNAADASPNLIRGVDEELAIAIGHANGDSSQADQLFIILWQRVEEFVRKRVMTMLRHYPDDIDELVALVQHRVKDKIRLYRLVNGASFRSWLFKIISSVVLNWLKKESRYVRLSEIDELSVGALLGTVPPVDEEFVYSEVRRIVRNAIQELPINQREVVKLMDYEGMKIEEVSCILKMSVSSVKVNHYRAKQNLKKILKSRKILEEIR